MSPPLPADRSRGQAVLTVLDSNDLGDRPRRGSRGIVLQLCEAILTETIVTGCVMVIDDRLVAIVEDEGDRLDGRTLEKGRQKKRNS